MVLYCAICIQIRTGELTEESEAITIRGGTAVCYDHLGHGHDPNVTNAIMLMRKKD